MIIIDCDVSRTNGLIVSDPGYGKDVSCRYVKTGLSAFDLHAQGFIRTIEVDDTNSDTPSALREALRECEETHLCLAITRKYKSLSTAPIKITLPEPDGDYKILHMKRVKNSKDFEIGVDTAHIYIGNTEEVHCQYFLPTGCDGEFGVVQEFVDYNPHSSESFAGIVIDCIFDGMFICADDLFDYIKWSLRFK